MVLRQDDVWIGIDLGTCNSVVGLWFKDQDKVEILPNPDSGKHTTPSVVTFRPDNQVVVGDAALNKNVNNISNTIYDSKRLIG